MIQQKMVPIALIEPNTGQIEGVPTNPRFIKNDAFKSLVMSIEQDPEMLQLREVILYPLGKKYVAIGGNQRYEACKFLKHKEVPSKILPADTDAETLKRIIIKDNGSWGANDLDALANEWSDLPLQDWGIDLPKAWMKEPEEEPEELTEEDKNKPATMKITFLSPMQLQKAEADIQEILDRKYKGAYYSVSAGEL